MPTYLYRYPGTDFIIEEFQKMTDPHVYIDDDGVEWERVWTIPAAGIDGKIDSFSSTDFIEKTRGKHMTQGDLWNASAEASQKRKDKLGYDPVKKEFFENYSKKRNGMKHQDDPSR